MILDAHSPLSNGGDVPSIAEVVELGHGTVGDVAAVAGAPLVVHVEQARADDLIFGRVIGEDAYDAAAALDLLIDLLEGISRQLAPVCAEEAMKASTLAFALSIVGLSLGRPANLSRVLSQTAWNWVPFHDTSELSVATGQPSSALPRHG